MDKETYRVLASVRMERAIELVDGAKELLQNERYKSANNRAFYAMEKTMKALLAIKEIDADSHNGCLRQFNVHYIKERVGGFEPGDYKRIANAQRIRNVSDYDDFYIADKKECQQQVEMATEFLNKARIFMEAN
ncbi:HEPN domain-containing protein [Clostridium sp. AF37-5]|jgi:uncharacterized protein (UPF0332 family)|uniref:HEPN domain-containing protein n=1 Tax=Clostridium sp. AF37-5 TaxID=2293016 RepID=UPI000E4C9CB6|nr:HEPN domain-containing protein [Clostridium sp. AF37-5]RHO94167.1 HEPN domain-containing protein [Clostridium sp. AF37-5]